MSGFGLLQRCIVLSHRQATGAQLKLYRGRAAVFRIISIWCRNNGHRRWAGELNRSYHRFMARQEERKEIGLEPRLPWREGTKLVSCQQTYGRRKNRQRVYNRVVAALQAIGLADAGYGWVEVLPLFSSAELDPCVESSEPILLDKTPLSADLTRRGLAKDEAIRGRGRGYGHETKPRVAGRFAKKAPTAASPHEVSPQLASAVGPEVAALLREIGNPPDSDCSLRLSRAPAARATSGPPAQPAPDRTKLRVVPDEPPTPHLRV